MTKDEFEKGYAERSKATVEELHSMGRFAVPCDCGEEMCHGWQMAHWTAMHHLISGRRKTERKLDD